MMTNGQVGEKDHDVKSEENISSTTQGLSSNTKSQITTGSIGMVQAFGITKQRKYIPTARRQTLKSIAKEERCVYTSKGQTLETENDNVRRSDTGETLHPVYSPLMQASHRSFSYTGIYHLKDFTQKFLRVFSSTSGFSQHDGEKNRESLQETSKTPMKQHSRHYTKDINPFDVLGIAKNRI